jgi:hypothetical protein
VPSGGAEEDEEERRKKVEGVPDGSIEPFSAMHAVW